MAIRKIMVPVRTDGKAEFVLDHGVHLARRLHALVEVVYCRPRPEDMLPYGISIPSGLREQLKSSASGYADHQEELIHKLYSDYAKRNDVAEIETGKEPPRDSASLAWREQTGRQRDIVAKLGRLADIIVISKPDHDIGLGIGTLEAVLMEAGRLMLLCPHKESDDVGRHVAIAWNGSMEGARTVAAALEVLEAADSRTILCEESRLEAPNGANDLLAYLKLYGLDAEIRPFTASAATAGRALLQHAQDAGATTMLMGAYGQSRRRELVMGGVTQHIVDHSELPVLMMH